MVLIEFLEEVSDLLLCVWNTIIIQELHEVLHLELPDSFLIESLEGCARLKELLLCQDPSTEFSLDFGLSYGFDYGGET